MGWQIPAQIEQDIISGKAQYRTFQTGVGGQSILPVANNAYAVIFGYDFSPAGGGFTIVGNTITGTVNDSILSPTKARFLETQQISFYTGTDFYPFVHHVNTEITNFVVTRNVTTGFAEVVRPIHSIDTTPISRQVYITSSNDISITVGLLLNTPQAIGSAIPVTNRTPASLTYGGSGQLISIQTDLGPAATPVEFVQPSFKDFQAFNIPATFPNVSEQAFATPDATNGLLDPSVYLTSLGATFRDAAACNYFLNIHYALYSQTIPEPRG